MHPRFIIYGLTDPRTGEIRYIGKSSRGLRRPQMHKYPSVCSGGGNPHKIRWIEALRRAGLEYGIVVLHAVRSAAELDDCERWASALARQTGYRLLNILDGGGDTATFTGRRHSPETIARMRAVKVGEKFSAEHVARISEAAKRRLSDPVQRERHIKMNIGKRHTRTPEFCAKLSAALRGKPKPYMAARNKAMQWTDEMRAKSSAARKAGPVNGKVIYVFSESGVRRTIADWSRRSGVNYTKLRYRIVDLGWSLERATSVGVAPRTRINLMRTGG